MAVATGTIRRRQKNEQKKLAAKSKRDKILLAGGGVVLLAVLAIEVPGMLSSGSSTPAPTPPPAAVATAPATAPVGGLPTAAAVRDDLIAIAKLPSKDPFKPQLDANGSVTTASQPLARAPHVRLSHFVVKDPFKIQVGAPASAAPAVPLATPPPVTSATSTKHKSTKPTAASLGYIVILRSLDSKAAATQEVRKAHAHGLAGAAILYSSRYTTLRHGYWVVYLSKYSTVSAANAGLQDARAHGYASAYRRPVKK
jgi:hypothetical protein